MTNTNRFAVILIAILLFAGLVFAIIFISSNVRESSEVKRHVLDSILKVQRDNQISEFTLKQAKQLAFNDSLIRLEKSYKYQKPSEIPAYNSVSITYKGIKYDNDFNPLITLEIENNNVFNITSILVTYKSEAVQDRSKESTDYLASSDNSIPHSCNISTGRRVKIFISGKPEYLSSFVKLRLSDGSISIGRIAFLPDVNERKRIDALLNR